MANPSAPVSPLSAEPKMTENIMDREQANEIIYLLTTILLEIRNLNEWKLREAEGKRPR